jgi:hypothetical protein
VRTLRARQARVPMLVAVNSRRALAHAARHADSIGLAMLGRTLEDGQLHEVRWQADRLDRTVAFIRDQAGERSAELELNALVQAVVVTNDRLGAAQELQCWRDAAASRPGRIRLPGYDPTEAA